jgi:hypothetical protein
MDGSMDEDTQNFKRMRWSEMHVSSSSVCFKWKRKTAVKYIHTTSALKNRFLATSFFALTSLKFRFTRLFLLGTHRWSWILSPQSSVIIKQTKKKKEEEKQFWRGVEQRVVVVIDDANER